MRPCPPLVLLLPVAIACKADEPVPDLVYKVTVTSQVDEGALVTNCVDSAPEYRETFTYELFFEGAFVDVLIDGESFASGTRSGCDLEYESAVWLEERGSGDLRWQLSGTTEYCEVEDGSDWKGIETIEIIESDDESVPAGCTYVMDTEGVLSGG